MTDKFLFFIEEEYNINVKKKFFIKANDNFTLSLYKLKKEDYEVYEELDDYYIGLVYLDVNGEVIEKVSKTNNKLITDIITSVFLMNLPKGCVDKFEKDVKFENLFKYFFLYAFDNNDFLFDNFLEIALENGWYKNKKEAIDIYNENEQFFEELYNLIKEDNFLIKYADKDNFFYFE